MTTKNIEAFCDTCFNLVPAFNLTFKEACKASAGMLFAFSHKIENVEERKECIQELATQLLAMTYNSENDDVEN